MFNKFFNFQMEPFSETPNTYFYFGSKTHQETIKLLAEHLDSGSGFISVTGEVGTGKTMIVRYLIKKCANEISSAYLYWPNLEGNALISAISREFGIINSDDPFHSLENFLLANASDKKRTVLFIDEAQSLSIKSLETIRLISNLECETKKLIQIVLIGQPELDAVLKKPEVRQINQRISKRLTISELTFDEVEMYVKHRLELAKAGNFVRFDLNAMKAIYNYSKGVPRLINLICRTALEYCLKEQIRVINGRLVKDALEDSNLLPKGAVGLFRKNSIGK